MPIPALTSICQDPPGVPTPALSPTHQDWLEGRYGLGSALPSVIFAFFKTWDLSYPGGKALESSGWEIILKELGCPILIGEGNKKLCSWLPRSVRASEHLQAGRV